MTLDKPLADRLDEFLIALSDLFRVAMHHVAQGFQRQVGVHASAP